MTDLADAARRKLVREHIVAFWPDHPIEQFTWELGPIRSQLPHFRVARVAPTTAKGEWVYLSVGVSDVAAPERLEFFLIAPAESPAHVETLAMIAHRHAIPGRSLTLGSIVDIGRPWDDGATCDHLLVSLPYPYGPNLERCEDVRVLWLLPITADEAAFARTQGVEALERRFDEVELNYLSLRRPSVDLHCG